MKKEQINVVGKSSTLQFKMKFFDQRKCNQFLKSVANNHNNIKVKITIKCS